MALETSAFSSMAALLRDRASRWAAHPAMRHKHRGIWHTTTWRQYFERVCQAAAALHALGLGPGVTSAILSENRPEWLIADFGAILCRAMSSGIYTTSSANQIDYHLDHSGSKILFVEDGEQYEKLADVAPATIAGLYRIVVFDMDGLDHVVDPLIQSWDDFLAEGAAVLENDPGLPDRLIDAIGPDDIALLIYTSGTTGAPKGAMISHDNLAAQVEAWAITYDIGLNDRSVCFLPLCHVAERLFSVFSPLANGTIVHFSESAAAVVENMREIKPTLVFAPPRFYEKIHAAIDLAMREARPSSQAAYARARRWVGAAMAPPGKVDTAPLGIVARTRRWIARHVLLRNVLRAMGMGSVRYSMTGAAPVSAELVDWYRGLGVNLFELYGMTETSGSQTRLNPRGPHRAAGYPVAIGELKIGPNDEVLVRGRHVFQGYLNDPENTAKTIEADGWLHTGDQGRLDEHGNLSIIGRIKDVMITSGGKNLTPSKIETLVKVSPFVTDALLIGDGRHYVTCLIMIDYDMVARHARDHGIAFTDYPSLCRKPEISDLIGREVANANDKLNQVEKIKKFRIIDVELDAEDEELTPTMKLRRAAIEAKYKDMIEDMYREEKGGRAS